VADVDPVEFDAVTLDRSLRPTSLVVRAYWADVTPAMVAHALPAESHRSHWNAWLVGEFDQVPVVETRVSPCCGIPLTTGTDVLTGAA